MTQVRRMCVTVVASLALCAEAAAQGIPGQGAPPPPPTGQTQPGQITEPGQLAADAPEPTDLEAKPPPSWTYTFSVNEMYESLAVAPGQSPRGEPSTRLDGSIGRAWTLKRGTFGMSGTANRMFYRGGGSLDALNYGFGLSSAYMLTHRLTWHVSESLPSARSIDNGLLATSGIVLPQVQTRSNVALSGISYQLSQKVQLEASVAETSVLFPDSAAAADLANGSSFTVQSRIMRQVGRSQSFGLSAGNTFSSGQTGDIQGVLGLWQATIGRGLTLIANGGVRPYTLFGAPGHRFAPGGSFAVAKRFNRGAQLSASYERAVEQAFGFNRTHLAHRVNAAAVVPIGRRLTFDTMGNYGLNTYPQIANYHLGGMTGVATMRFRVGSQLFVGANYGVWNHFESAVRSTRDYRAGVSLTYGGVLR